jgi:hypothetical protein
MTYRNTTTFESRNPLATAVSTIAALSASEEAAAVVAGYRAMQADAELHRHRPGSEARRQRMAAILAPVAEAWGISTRDLILAVGRNVE